MHMENLPQLRRAAPGRLSARGGSALQETRGSSCRRSRGRAPRNQPCCTSPAPADAHLGKMRSNAALQPGKPSTCASTGCIRPAPHTARGNSCHRLSATVFPCHKHIFRTGTVCCFSSPVGHVSLHVNKDCMGVHVYRVQKTDLLTSDS